MARLDSVTVSIAADASGILSESLRVKQVRVSTCVGKIEDLPGSRSTSSNVKPSGMGPSIIPTSFQGSGERLKTAQPSGWPLGRRKNSSNRKNESLWSFYCRDECECGQ